MFEERGLKRSSRVQKEIITDDENGPNHINFINFDSMKNYLVNQLQEHCEITFSGNISSI